MLEDFEMLWDNTMLWDHKSSETPDIVAFAFFGLFAWSNLEDAELKNLKILKRDNFKLGRIKSMTPQLWWATEIY